MKIALFAPYFTQPGGKLPVWFEYWQKSAAYNRDIDFFVPTNVDVSHYKKYDNIHFICMSVEEFWDKLDNILGFKGYRSYYKTTEYRVFFGILFKDILKNYDYWGSSDPDVIYGDIMKYIRPYIDNGEEVIGKYAHIRIIKNTDKLRYLPFEEIRGVEHPLDYKTAFSTEYIWYFCESGMNERYAQAGINVIELEKYYGHIHEMYKYFLCLGNEGKWGFFWKNGKLTGYNDANEEREFMYIHIMRRNLSLSDNNLPSDKFCIVPNIIINNCDRNDNITPGTMIYTLRKTIDRYKKYFRKMRILSSKDLLVLMDVAKRAKETGTQASIGPQRLRKIAYIVKKLASK